MLPTLVIGAGKTGTVLLDARSQRAYFGMIEKGKLRKEEVLPLSEIQAREETGI
ncbi:MAG: hypothetical protein ACLSFJ_09965 [Holdemania filiformis]